MRLAILFLWAQSAICKYEVYFFLILSNVVRKIRLINGERALLEKRNAQMLPLLRISISFFAYERFTDEPEVFGAGDVYWEDYAF